MEIYNVYVGKKHIDMIKAVNEKDACNRIELKWGPSSKWSCKKHSYIARCVTKPLQKK